MGSIHVSSLIHVIHQPQKKTKPNGKYCKIAKKPEKTCLTPEKLSLKMLTCPRICSKTPSTLPPKQSRNTISKRTLPRTSRKSSTRSTTQLGIALLVGTLDLTLPTKPSISFTFTWGRLPFFCSNPDK